MTTETTTTMTADEVMAVESAHVLQTYRRAPVVFERGKGCRLYDAAGRGYLDFISGIGVSSLGHAHPRLVAAIAAQAEQLIHTSNLYFHPLQAEAATKLAALSGLPRVFFCNSGTEAVEACLKFARRYWFTQGTPRSQVIAFERAFHGRTMGALSTTWDEHYRTPFAPLLDGVTFVSNSDPSELAAAVSEKTAAIIVEPLQGEGGVRPVPPPVARAIEKACQRTGALLICDEIQCGLGRTGPLFHFPSLGLTPDLVSVAKALGGGFPIGAALVADTVAATIAAGDHGTTYGGNLLACRAALTVLDTLEGGLLDHVAAIGPVMERGLREMVGRLGLDAEIRGKGLMWGIDLGRDAGAVVPAGLARGVVVNRTAGSVVRLLPPYVITEAELAEGLGLLEAAIADAVGGARG